MNAGAVWVIIKNFFGPQRNYILAGLAILAMISSTFGAGFIQGRQFEVNHDKKQFQTQTANTVAAIVKQDDAAAQNRIEVKVRDIAREQALEGQLNALQYRNLQLQSQLNAQAPGTSPFDVCFVPYADVVMLNKAREPISDYTKRDPDAAFLLAIKDTSPSTTSCRALVADDIAASSAFEELRSRNNALIDWVQVELIDPMQLRLTHK